MSGDRRPIDTRVKNALAHSAAQPRPERQSVETEQPRPMMNIAPKQSLWAKADGLPCRQRDVRNLSQFNRDLDRRVPGANNHNALVLKWRGMPV
jgi:hypothetical protein